MADKLSFAFLLAAFSDPRLNPNHRGGGGTPPKRVSASRRARRLLNEEIARQKHEARVAIRRFNRQQRRQLTSV